MARLECLSKNMAAILDTIAWAEGTMDHPLTQDDGYDIIVNPGGVFTDYSKHPQKRVEFQPGHFSTAAGRYQLLGKYYEHYRGALDLPDFGPSSQDRIAVQQIRECKAVKLIEDGQIREAITKLSRIWASLPGSPYKQPTRSMAKCLAKYDEFGGSQAGVSDV